MNPNQRKIVQQLLQGTQITVAELAATLKVTPQAARKDMSALQGAGVAEKRGRSALYAFADLDHFGNDNEMFLDSIVVCR